MTISISAKNFKSTSEAWPVYAFTGLFESYDNKYNHEIYLGDDLRDQRISVYIGKDYLYRHNCRISIPGEFAGGYSIGEDKISAFVNALKDAGLSSSREILTEDDIEEAVKAIFHCEEIIESLRKSERSWIDLMKSIEEDNARLLQKRAEEEEDKSRKSLQRIKKSIDLKNKNREIRRVSKKKDRKVSAQEELPLFPGI